MYDSLIIGAGQIAGGYDSLESEAVLTHAHAYKRHKDFNLLGFYDIDFNSASNMAKKWDCSAFTTLDEIKTVDVISICTPDEYHLESVKAVLKLNPKIIFLEKPLSNDIEEAKEIISISKKIPILVNYSRRFTPEFQEIALKIKNNEFGNYQSGNGLYGKGFIHNGSHMTNLLNLLLGKIDKQLTINEFVDFKESDPTKTMILTMGNSKQFIMGGLDCRNFDIFEMDLIFEKGRIKIIEFGNKIEVYKVVEYEKIKGYKVLGLDKIIETQKDFAMLKAVENIAQYLDCNTELLSTVEQAYEAIFYG